MNQFPHEMLFTGNNITINKPLSEVWGHLTKANQKYTWIDDEGGYLISSWREDDKITWKTSDDKDYYRGIISSRVDQQSISFTIHDAYEEDTMDPEFNPDWNEETWKISFKSEKDTTILTIEILDYDSEHDTDDIHDHEETIASSEKVSQEIIPGMLKKIKTYCEQQ